MKQLALFTLVGLLFCGGLKARQQLQHTSEESNFSSQYSLPSMPVGIDDLIYVSVYDSADLSRTVRVGANGAIRLPLLKEEIKVDGMMPSEIEKTVSKELQAEQILVDPVVSVTVVEYKSRPISVVGAVRTPLIFQALPGTTLLDAITRAGGLSENAGSEIIITHRIPAEAGKSAVVSQRVSAIELLEKANASANLFLSGGEEVRVPDAGKFFVMGNVRRPGSFPVRQQSDITVLKAISLAEGLDKFASKTAYIIRRDAPSGKQEVPVELSKILDRKAADVPLEANDILYIPDNKTKHLTLGTLSTLTVLGTAATSTMIYTAR